MSSDSHHHFDKVKSPITRGFRRLSGDDKPVKRNRKSLSERSQGAKRLESVGGDTHSNEHFITKSLSQFSLSLSKS